MAKSKKTDAVQILEPLLKDFSKNITKNNSIFRETFFSLARLVVRDWRSKFQPRFLFLINITEKLLGMAVVPVPAKIVEKIVTAVAGAVVCGSQCRKPFVFRFFEMLRDYVRNTETAWDDAVLIPVIDALLFSAISEENPEDMCRS